MSKTFLRRPRADCTRVLGTIWNEVFDNYLARIIYSIYPLPWCKSMAQSLKLKLVPLTQNLGQLGPPKKRVNFDICNRRHKWLYCVYWQCHFDTLSFPEQIQFCTPLGAYWIVLSPTLFGQLDTLALKANKFSGPPAFWSPQLALVPRTCAQTLRTGIYGSSKQKLWITNLIPIVAVESVVSASQSGQEGPRQMTFTLLLPIGCQKKARRWSRKIFIEMRSSSAHIKAFSSESGLIVRNIFLILLQLYSQIWWSIWHAHSLFNAW